MARSLLRYSLSNANNMDLKNPLSPITKRMSPGRRKKLEKAAKVTVGTAAALWMVLRLKRELYGPGGSKMSRYRPDVDKVWKRD
jgi:hypothetical protein